MRGYRALQSLLPMTPVRTPACHAMWGGAIASMPWRPSLSDKWEYFVAGEPIEQMSDATEEATHGQLVLSTSAHQILAAGDEFTHNTNLVGEVLESTQFLLTAITDAPPRR